jgi:peptidoglycan/LPS O-acetylase OafA/YrhL/lysophospholipase L1-like esterase
MGDAGVPPTRGARLPHVGALDGLRAVSLIAVLLYHGGFGWAKGGFLGVSTFFTLSGFLITSLLLVENHQNGRISLRRFWSARARRLVPAALIALLLVAAFALFAASPTQITGLRGDLLSVFGVGTNWRLALSGREYGAYLTTSSPVQHVWSLAVEEQFYLCLPVLVVLAARGSSRPQRRLAIFAAVLGLASTTALVLSVSANGNTTWAYYATHTRAAELLAGVFLACTVHHLAKWRWRPYVVPVLGVIASAAIVFAWATADQASTSLYRGGITGYTLASVAVIIASLQRGPVRFVLELPALQWLGRISYGAYLYHWPLFLWITEERIGIGGIPLFAVRVGMTILIALLSAAVVELPIRRRQIIPRMTLGPACVVAITALALMMTVPSKPTDTGPSGIEVAMGQRVVAPGSPEPTVAPTTATTSPPSSGAPVTSTTLPPKPDVQRLMLVGDSITRQIAPYFAERYPAVDVRWVGADGIGPLTDQGRIVPVVHQAVEDFDPDVVLFEFAGSYTNKRGGSPFRTSDGTEVQDGTELMFQMWDQQSRLLVREARSNGALVLWALAPPVDPDGYFKYLAPNITRFNDIYKALPGVQLVDWFAASAADGGRFAASLAASDGHTEQVRSGDGLHFTAFGYRRLVAVASDAISFYEGRSDVVLGPTGRPSD